MTFGAWKCMKCGFEEVIPISQFIEKCSACGVEYELIEELRGAHPVHIVPIFRMKGNYMELATYPGVFAHGPKRKSLERYFKASKNMGPPLTLGGKK